MTMLDYRVVPVASTLTAKAITMKQEEPYHAATRATAVAGTKTGAFTELVDGRVASTTTRDRIDASDPSADCPVLMKASCVKTASLLQPVLHGM